MNTNLGWIHGHLRILIAAMIMCVLLGVFFLAPIIPVLTVGCATDWESPGYHFYKTGYHMLVQPNNGCQ